MNICDYNSALNSEKKYNYGKIYESYFKYQKLLYFEIFSNYMSLKPRILLFQLYLYFFCTNFEFLEYHATKSENVGDHSWLFVTELLCIKR